MAAAHTPRHGKHAQSPGTLGDVLYANPSQTLVSENDWVLLVRAVAAGDQPALHALYERAHRIVYTLTMRLTGSRETAEELTLDVFHDVWRKASRYDPADGTVLGWIMNQARSRAIDRLRFEQRKKRMPPQDTLSPEGSAPDGEEILESLQRARRLREALAVLTAAERQAIEVAFFQGLTYGEVAEQCNQPLGTIKTRIRSGLQKLRETLFPERHSL